MRPRNAPRLSRRSDGLAIDGRPVPYGAGALPRDFVTRLNRLKRASGLTWNDFADALGVDKKQVLRWRQGTEPSGGAYHSLVQLASRVRGGLDILMGEGFQASLRES